MVARAEIGQHRDDRFRHVAHPSFPGAIGRRSSISRWRCASRYDCRTSSGASSSLMSRAATPARPPGARRRPVPQMIGVRDDVTAGGRLVAGLRREQRHQQPARPQQRDQPRRQGGRLAPVEVVEDVPREDAVHLSRSCLSFTASRDARPSPPPRGNGWSTSAYRSSGKSLHPSCEPRKLTLEPMTGPRSTTTGTAPPPVPAGTA